jgi:hypothetical protein
MVWACKDSEYLKMMVKWNIHRDRPRGHPKKQWIDEVKQNLKITS